MKLQISKSILTGLLTVGVIHSAMANNVTLVNQSPSVKSMEVTYKIAHEKSGQEPVYSAAHTLTLTDRSVVTFDMDDADELAGLVLVKVDDHLLPANASQFNKPNQCWIATSKAHPSNSNPLTIVYSGSSSKEGSLKCITPQGRVS